MNMEERIVVNPKIMVGKPIIKGTRIPVDAILKRLADGMSISDILEEYPNITEEDIRASTTNSSIRMRLLETLLKSTDIYKKFIVLKDKVFKVRDS